jgi:S1-C subfamily serine protease
MNNRLRTSSAKWILFAGALYMALTSEAWSRAIPVVNLAFPVLITLKSQGTTVGSGSGFYYRTESSLYLVTARHVLSIGVPNPQTKEVRYPDLSVEVLSWSKDDPNPKRNVISFSFAGVHDSGALKLHPSRDVAVVKVGSVVQVGDATKVAWLPGVSIREMSESGIVWASAPNVATFEKVLVGNDAILFGYPASLGLPNTHQFDPLRPLLRKALIAGEDPERRSLIIDGPVYRGNSGGPVFEIDQEQLGLFHFYLVGVLVEFIPLTENAPDFTMLLNSGYSVAEPMDFVLELTQ